MISQQHTKPKHEMIQNAFSPHLNELPLLLVPATQGLQRPFQLPIPGQVLQWICTGNTTALRSLVVVHPVQD